MSNYGKSLYLNVTDFKKMLFREKRLENRINFEEIQRKFKAKSPPRSPQKKTTVISNDNQTRSPKKDSQMSFHGNFLTEEYFFKKLFFFLIYLKNSLKIIFLNKSENKMLIFIKDVLTKPMNEGSPVVIEEAKGRLRTNGEMLKECQLKREVNETRLFALKKNQVNPQKLNFFSLDKRVQNIKFENLHLV